MSKTIRLVIWLNGFGLGASLMVFGSVPLSIYPLIGLLFWLPVSAFCIYLLMTKFSLKDIGEKDGKPTNNTQNTSYKRKSITNFLCCLIRTITQMNTKEGHTKAHNEKGNAR
jgi:hypothetical protein